MQSGNAANRSSAQQLTVLIHDAADPQVAISVRADSAPHGCGILQGHPANAVWCSKIPHSILSF